MENVLNVAAYITHTYFLKYGQQIDEMKLHKLMYFTQRESLIQTGEPLFNATFYGWKYGPVLREIRSIFKENKVDTLTTQEFEKDNSEVFKRVFEKYAEKESWSLSRLTQGEYSWKKSREGIPDGENSDKPMKLEDIKKDAERIRNRIAKLIELGLSEEQ